MTRIFAILAFTVGISIASGNIEALGEPKTTVHEVSVAELLARAEFFDQQPVRVIGVGIFDFRFEGQSAVYASADDARYESYASISLHGFVQELKGSKKQLAKMSGKWVVVEGIFHAIPRERYEESEMVVCPRGCPQPGFIDHVNRVDVRYIMSRVES